MAIWNGKTQIRLNARPVIGKVQLAKRSMKRPHEAPQSRLTVELSSLARLSSKVVHQAVRKKCGGPPAARTQAMQAVVGLWKDRSDLPDTDIYLRRFRKGKRLTRISF